MPDQIKTAPGSYWFGISYESDMAFADRLNGKTKRNFIEAVNEAWRDTMSDQITRGELEKQVIGVLRNHHYLPTQEDIHNVFAKVDDGVLDTGMATKKVMALIDQYTSERERLARIDEDNKIYTDGQQYKSTDKLLRFVGNRRRYHKSLTNTKKEPENEA